jgi:hypothetical protein
MAILKEYNIHYQLNEDDDENIDIDNLGDEQSEGEDNQENPKNTDEQGSDEGDMETPDIDDILDTQAGDMPSEDSSQTKEIDVTDIIKRQDDLVRHYNNIIGKLSGIEKMNTEIESIKSQISGIKDDFTKNVSSIKDEIKKRNPTPNEKIRLQSLSSFPYNVPVDTYFQRSENQDMPEEYKISISNPTVQKINDEDVNKKANDYVLTINDILDGYNQNDVMKSF